MAGRSHLLVIPVRSSTDFIEAKTCFTCHVSDPDCVPFYIMDLRPFIKFQCFCMCSTDCFHQTAASCNETNHNSLS